MKKRFFSATRFIFLNDAGTKVLSLGIAVLLWMYVDSVTTAEHVVADVPIAVEMPERITLLRMAGEGGSETRTVTLTIRGPKALVEDAKRLRLTCTPNVSINPAQVGDEWTTEYPLSSDDFNVTRGLSLTFVPQRLRLTVAALREEDMRVTTENCFIGKPADGFEVGGAPIVEPDVVRVRGPAKAFSGPDKKIKTANIARDDRSADFTVRVPLKPELNGQRVTTVEKDVLVRVSIRPVPVTEVLDKVRVHVLSPPGTSKRSFAVDPAEISITIQGPRKAVEEFKKEYAKKDFFFAYVDATDPLLPSLLPSTGGKVPVVFYLSPRVSKDIVVRDTNVQVNLTIEEAPAE